MKHNVLRIMFGNEDKIESTEDMLWFETPQEAANFLRKVADNIDRFKTSKEYRASDASIFDELDLTKYEIGNV